MAREGVFYCRGDKGDRGIRWLEALAEVFIEGAHEVISPGEIMWNNDRYL
jgi:hypothetical protein